MIHRLMNATLNLIFFSGMRNANLFVAITTVFTDSYSVPLIMERSGTVKCRTFHSQSKREVRNRDHFSEMS